ncbi:MAG TPA: hypothetical protein VFK39_09585 [Gemmatimonadaceae bacterium]|nr:hypothetical protein [Gemmatimonadaceae bacterium]
MHEPPLTIPLVVDPRRGFVAWLAGRCASGRDGMEVRVAAAGVERWMRRE